ncbi:MAG: flagellin N-terminal helical domain-containing protein [Limisphaerales bacterium]
MRVPFNAAPSSLVYQLNQLTARQSQLQGQAASGQRVALPEDDPSAVQRVFTHQLEASANKQFSQNIGLLKEQAGAGLDAMRGLQKVVDRAGEIAILADDTKSPDELRIYAVEIGQLIRQAAQSMNSRFRDEFLFSGTRSDQPPFVVVEDAQGQVTGVNYQGSTDLPEIQISAAERVAVKVPGANTSGAGARGVVADSRSGADLFNHLISLRDHLLAGDTAAISATDRPALRLDEDNLVLHLGENAALQARLEAASSLSGKRASSLRALISQEVDADLASTLVSLNAAQNAYRAALQSGATLMGTSLMDYLR